MTAVSIVTMLLEACRIGLFMRCFHAGIGNYRVSKKVAVILFLMPWMFESFMMCLFPNSREAQIMVTDTFLFCMEIPCFFLLSVCYKGSLARHFLIGILVPAFYWIGKWIIVFVLFSTISIDSFLYFLATAVTLFVFGILEFLWEKIGKSRQELERELLEQEIRIYENQFEVIRQSENNIRSLKHDMKHHVKMLHDLIAEEEKEAALHYLESMGEFMENSEEYVSSGNERFDSILNYMIARAKSLGIAIDWKIQIPENLELSTFDINVILSNLFENAFHALEYVTRPTLYVLMKYDRGILCISMENNCAHRKGADAGKVPLSGTGEGHGFGLKNIRRIAEKYHGSLSTSCSDGIFHADVLLFLE